MLSAAECAVVASQDFSCPSPLISLNALECDCVPNPEDGTAFTNQSCVFHSRKRQLRRLSVELHARVQYFTHLSSLLSPRSPSAGKFIGGALQYLEMGQVENVSVLSDAW